MRTIRLSIRETAESIQRLYGGHIVPDWKLRRIVDALDSRDSLDVQRIGMYRTISADDVGIVADELHRVGWLKREVSVKHSAKSSEVMA